MMARMSGGKVYASNMAKLYRACARSVSEIACTRGNADMQPGPHIRSAFDLVCSAIGEQYSEQHARRADWTNG
jgi:hypothetical protein